MNQQIGQKRTRAIVAEAVRRLHEPFGRR